MADDVLINKTAVIERSVKRAHEEYQKDSSRFAQDLTRQDAAILNIQRACEAALDMGQHLIRREKLGLPQSARDVFTLLTQNDWISDPLANSLKRMVGFRNIVTHAYQALQLSIVISIIEHKLDDFLVFSRCILQNDSAADQKS